MEVSQHLSLIVASITSPIVTMFMKPSALVCVIEVSLK